MKRKELNGFEPAENRMRKCPRCGRPIVIPRATFCCIGCAIEDKEENDERIKTVAEYEPEDIESWRDRLARVTKEQMNMVAIESEDIE